jgi:hypothetical protein
MRYPNAVLLWSVTQPKSRSSNKKLPIRTWVSVGTVWQSRLLECGCQIKGILLDILISYFHWQATCSAHYKLLHSTLKKWILQGPHIECTHFED